MKNCIKYEFVSRSENKETIEKKKKKEKRVGGRLILLAEKKNNVWMKNWELEREDNVNVRESGHPFGL